MSLILDALRKSERTRQQSLAGRVSAADPPPARARIPVPWATIVGLLLIVNVVVLGIIFWRSHTQRIAPAPIATAANAAEPPAPAPVYRPAVRSLAAEAAAAGTAPASVQAVTAPSTLSVASAAKPLSPSATGVTASVSATSTTTISQPASTGVVVLNTDNAPLLDTLPLAFQQSLPPLHLDVHSYSANPAERFVVINMQRYRTGDTLKAGPKIISIVADGVVLEYHGQEFLLPRP
jgi:general secretion pathway protein B